MEKQGIVQSEQPEQHHPRDHSRGTLGKPRGLTKISTEISTEKQPSSRFEDKVADTVRDASKH